MLSTDIVLFVQTESTCTGKFIVRMLIISAEAFALLTVFLFPSNKHDYYSFIVAGEEWSFPNILPVISYAHSAYSLLSSVSNLLPEDWPFISASPSPIVLPSDFLATSCFIIFLCLIILCPLQHSSEFKHTMVPTVPINWLTYPLGDLLSNSLC